jgi:hypothetical protein
MSGRTPKEGSAKVGDQSVPVKKAIGETSEKNSIVSDASEMRMPAVVRTVIRPHAKRVALIADSTGRRRPRSAEPPGAAGVFAAMG